MNPLLKGTTNGTWPVSYTHLVAEARTLAENGVRELVLVAQDTTLYGEDLYGESRLPELLEQLCEIDGLAWIRLLYCYPEHITDRLLDVIAAQEKVLPYLDIPIQHCSGKVLRAMNRTGDAAWLKELIAHIRRKVPGMVLRTTVMTGFPGEGEEEFEELCDFIQEVRFERLGCFAFSPEEGTAAVDLPDQVPEEEKNRRRELVMEEQARIAGEYNEAQMLSLIHIFDFFGIGVVGAHAHQCRQGLAVFEHHHGGDALHPVPGRQSLLFIDIHLAHNCAPVILLRQLFYGRRQHLAGHTPVGPEVHHQHAGLAQRFLKLCRVEMNRFRHVIPVLVL